MSYFFSINDLSIVNIDSFRTRLFEKRVAAPAFL